MHKKLDIPSFFEGPPPFKPEAAQLKTQHLGKPPRRKLHVTGNRQASALGILAAGAADTD
jgi:hypothetical protein